MIQRFEDAFGDETEVEVVTHEAGPLRGQTLVFVTVDGGYGEYSQAAFTPATARRVGEALIEAARHIEEGG